MKSHHISLSSVLTVVTLLLGVPPSWAADAAKPTAEEMAEARQFVAAKFTDPKATHPPFSFVYNGKPSA